MDAQEKDAPPGTSPKQALVMAQSKELLGFVNTIKLSGILLASLETNIKELVIRVEHLRQYWLANELLEQLVQTPTSLKGDGDEKHGFPAIPKSGAKGSRRQKRNPVTGPVPAAKGPPKDRIPAASSVASEAGETGGEESPKSPESAIAEEIEQARHEQATLLANGYPDQPS